jgi:hypothetical protein
MRRADIGACRHYNLAICRTTCRSPERASLIPGRAYADVYNIVSANRQGGYEMRRRAAICFSLFLISYGSDAAPRLETGIDADAPLPYWQISDAGMSLRLVQRLPDQTRGYFLARGFEEPEANLIANSCVFQTVFKNESNHNRPSALQYNLRDWVVTAGGKQQGMKLREDWQREWQHHKVTMAAKLAFEWSLYPTQQVYKPGDYNWGMSIFNLKPGTRFDLKVVWQQFGKTHTALIKDIQCAADVHPQPGSGGQP